MFWRRTKLVLSSHYTFCTLYDKDSTENTASNIPSTVACVFVAMGTCLPSRCLAAKCGRDEDTQ
jgi:hypothetical protein